SRASRPNRAISRAQQCAAQTSLPSQDGYVIRPARRISLSLRLLQAPQGVRDSALALVKRERNLRATCLAFVAAAWPYNRRLTLRCHGLLLHPRPRVLHFGTQERQLKNRVLHSAHPSGGTSPAISQTLLHPVRRGQRVLLQRGDSPMRQ